MSKNEHGFFTISPGRMMLQSITPLILTYNEESNIARVLNKLRWAREVVILDSGSTDRTVDIASSFPNTRIAIRAFDSHASQWNYGLSETGIGSEWILALDADYVLSDALVAEMAALVPDSTVAGYRIRFRYCIEGRRLSGSLYPPVSCLYRREKARYVQDGHTQRAVIDGKVNYMNSFIFHDDRKPLGRWLIAQDRYAQLECELLERRNWRELRWQDRIRKLIFVTPWLVPLYCMTVGKGFRDGWHGIYYAMQRGLAETVLSLKLLKVFMSSESSAEDAANISEKTDVAGRRRSQ